MWTTYLPNSELSWVEYNATCAEVYREIIEQQGGGKLYVGDQANVTFLNTIIADQAGQLYDVIIDDGEGKDSIAPTCTLLTPSLCDMDYAR